MMRDPYVLLKGTENRVVKPDVQILKQAQEVIENLNQEVENRENDYRKKWEKIKKDYKEKTEDLEMMAQIFGICFLVCLFTQAFIMFELEDQKTIFLFLLGVDFICVFETLKFWEIICRRERQRDHKLAKLNDCFNQWINEKRTYRVKSKISYDARLSVWLQAFLLDDLVFLKVNHQDWNDYPFIMGQDDDKIHKKYQLGRETYSFVFEKENWEKIKNADDVWIVVEPTEN